MDDTFVCVHGTLYRDCLTADDGTVYCVGTFTGTPATGWFQLRPYPLLKNSWTVSRNLIEDGANLNAF